MEDDDLLAQFASITSAPTDRARQYLQITDYNLEQALQLYFESDGADLGGTISNTAAQTQHQQSQPPQQRGEIVNLDSDDEDGGGVPMPMQTTGQSTRHGPSIEDDEAMARRMQEEMYGGGGAGVASGLSTGTGMDIPEEPVRAPMARTTETLADWRDDPDDMHSAVLEQLRARTQRPSTRPGIFNQQRPAGSIWDPSGSTSSSSNTDPSTRRNELSRATGGASDSSSKTTLLAEMYRPPFELMSPLTDWQDLRDEGKAEEKWLLVNVQDANVFDCQVLNRDIWKNTQVADTVRENFLFKQYSKDDPEGQQYVRYYFPAAESMDAYPHIAIVDPRTGEQVKVWSGAPAPKAMDFVMQLHEFLDRYSLKADRRNPVANRKAGKARGVDVGKMSEEEMLEMAMKNSLEAGPGLRDLDPDDLTRHSNGSTPAVAPPPEHANGRPQTPISPPAQPPTPPTEPEPTSEPTPFSLIPSDTPHTEPPSTAPAPSTTRIQFRHPGGRVIRRFLVADPVRTLYEWLKAEPLEGMVAGQAFELVFMGRNLIDDVVEGRTVEEAGLKNGSVMVELGAGAE